MKFIAQSVRELMAELGFRTVEDMVGRVECLHAADSSHWKTRGLDLSQILFRPDAIQTESAQCSSHRQSLDKTTLLPLCEPALARGETVSATLKIKNTDRTVGTRLGSEVTRLTDRMAFHQIRST